MKNILSTKPKIKKNDLILHTHTHTHTHTHGHIYYAILHDSIIMLDEVRQSQINLIQKQWFSKQEILLLYKLSCQNVFNCPIKL